MKLSLDSSDPNAQIDAPELRFLGELFKLESVIAYVVLLDDRAKVKTIEGTAQLREKAGLDSQIASEEFQNVIATDRLKAKFEQAIRSLPDVPAKLGEPWGADRTSRNQRKTVHASEEVRVSRHREEGR